MNGENTDPNLRLAVDDHGQPEIFYSIQGEGASTGAPRAFIRLSGCNLHCIWCDTAYTWNWQGTPFEHVSGEKYAIDEESLTVTVSDIVETVKAFNPSGVVITGGEPLQQKSKLPSLIQALREACGDDLFVEIETNGSIAPTAELFGLVDQFNVSPKLSHSGNDPAIALRSDVMSGYLSHQNAWFKFVIDTPEAVAEVISVSNAHDIPSHKVILMPLGTTPEALSSRRLWLSELCLTHGFRFSDRLHIHMYGDSRGT